VSFQRGFLRQPDGLIEVGGTSWRRLTHGAGTPATPSPAADWSGDSARWPQEKKLASLNPPFRAKVETVLTRLRGRGFQSKIVFGWRSVAVQMELVRTGRPTVHFSFHNAQRPDGTPNAYAADIVDERWGWEPAAEENSYWEALGEEARALGLVWGGDWRTFKDVAHIQGRQNSELAATKRESGL
jgi:peptidoglycan L-alanyl-D-glutamate endopeptidase CwlK